MSVDGNDFQILEPALLNPLRSSYKLTRPGLRYERGLCIKNESIFWANGPRSCGKTDLLIFCDRFRCM